MKVLGVIPARGGSKRVKDKNIRPLAGRPLIEYTLEAAANAETLTDVVVSTDSERIKQVVESFGMQVPFLRPEEFAADSSPDRPVLLHALKFMESTKSMNYDAIALLRPTSPLRTSVLIDQVVKKLFDSSADSVRTMTKAQGIHHPFWMYTMSENGQAVPFDSQHTAVEYYQSNLLPPVYHLNGMVDVMTTQSLWNHESMYGPNMSIFETDEAISVDIDTELDLKIAELLIKNRSDVS